MMENDLLDFTVSIKITNISFYYIFFKIYLKSFFQIEVFRWLKFLFLAIYSYLYIRTYFDHESLSLRGKVSAMNYVKHAKSLKKNLSNRILKAYIKQKKNVRSDIFLGEKTNWYIAYLEVLKGIQSRCKRHEWWWNHNQEDWSSKFI